MDYRIHRATPQDWHQLRAVRLQALADAPAAFGSTLDDEQTLSDSEWQRRSRRAGAAQFLAIATPHAPIGIAVGAPCRGQQQAAGLYSMWVAPAARKQGVGAALVHAVIDWAKAEGYTRMVLDLSEANLAAARLYKACGFVPTGRTGTLPPPRQHLGKFEMDRPL